MLDNFVENGGLIVVDGGMVLLFVGVCDVVLVSVVNNSGVVEVCSVCNVNGMIVLEGGGVGSVVNIGMLDVFGFGMG